MREVFLDNYNSVTRFSSNWDTVLGVSNDRRKNKLDPLDYDRSDQLMHGE